MSDPESRQQILTEWSQDAEYAEELIPLLGKLYRRSTIVHIFERPLQNRSDLTIIKEHKYASDYLSTPITIKDTYPLLKAIVQYDNLGAIRIDIGKITYKYKKQLASSPQLTVDDFLRQELKDAFSLPKRLNEKPRDIVLFGFGRIGRLIARILIEKTGGGDKMLLKAIVIRDKKIPDDLEKRASLLRLDSVHGQFRGVIEVDHQNRCIIANGNVIQVIYSNDPSQIDYTQYDINNAILVDNSGVFRDRKSLSKHLQCKGIDKVLLTAPGKDVPNIVAGVNQDHITPEERIYSAASCTTNAIVPVLKVLNSKFDIAHCHIETVHSYTQDQSLLDNIHKKERRGRAAPLNMVITESGSSEAVRVCLPELEGKVTGNAIRVPTPNVSLAIMIINVNNNTTLQEVNDYLFTKSLNSRQIGFSKSTEIVSSDLIGSTHAGVVDAPSTRATNLSDTTAVLNLKVWYENEFAYSAQVVRVLQILSDIQHPRFPSHFDM